MIKTKVIRVILTILGLSLVLSLTGYYLIRHKIDIGRNGLNINRMIRAKFGDIGPIGGYEIERYFRYRFFRRKSEFKVSVVLSQKEKHNYLLLENLTDSLIGYYCQDGHLRMVQEAMDIDGKWRAIEYWEPSTCGFSNHYCKLESKHFIYFEIHKYTGDYWTKLRVKYWMDQESQNSKYSPSFYGKINKKQFEIPLEVSQNIFVKM